MIRHVVMWKLAAADAAERSAQASEIARRLNALAGVVPQIIAIDARANTLFPDANWDATLTVDFASTDDLAGYQVHPAHEEVVAFMRPLVGSRAAVDFEV